jgi:hypothetical protein
VHLQLQNLKLTVSPRVQFAIKPDWEKEMVLEFCGLYHQPPFYRELRDATGTVQPTKAQQSVHFVLGNDYSFKMWNRPFKLVSSCIINPNQCKYVYTIDTLCSQ